MIPGFLTWATSLVRLASAVAKTDEDKQEFSSTLSALDWATNASRAVGSGSVQQSASRALISPMVVFEETLMYQDYMDDLMTIINLRDIKDALTHLTLEGSVGGVKISRLVNQINPNRAAGYMSLAGAEAFSSPEGSIFSAPKEGKNETVSIDSNDTRNLTEYQPLALGRTVKANTLIDGKEISFFLTFRQIPVAATSSDIELMFSAAKNGEGWNARFKDYSAGGITRPELLKGTDVIAREFNIRTREMSGYYNEAMQRESSNIRESIRTGVISMNTLANTVIISKDTANNIEADLGIRFNSPKIKTLRKAMNANTIVVVNDARGVFEFYTVSDTLPVKYTLQQIRQKSKKEDSGSLEALIKLLNGR